MALEKIAGTTQCTISTPDGAVNINVEGSLSVRVSGVMREVKVGASGRKGIKEMPQAGRMVIACQETSEFSQADVAGWDDVTVTARAASGKVYVLRGAHVGETELELVEGTFQLEFEGDCDEILPS